MKVLLAVDGSEYTKRMLGYLATNPELLGAGNALTALTVVSPIPTTFKSGLTQQVFENYYQTTAEERFEPIKRFAAQKAWELSAIWKVGRASEAIAEIANNEQFDLIVMGSHGHSALSGMLLGSVVTEVLAQSRKPVLIVR